jgi:hypothetical protein
MIESTWRIVWDPLGLDQQCLLGYGDLMEDEHARSLTQLTSGIKADFAASATPRSFKNVGYQLDFSRRNAGGGGGNLYGLADVLGGIRISYGSNFNRMWGQKRLLQIQGFGVDAVFYLASLLSVRSRVIAPEEWVDVDSVHDYSFVLARYKGQGLGGVCYHILGGVIIPDPNDESGDPYLNIFRFNLSNAAAFQVGDAVYISGPQQSGIPSGLYFLDSKTGNSVFLRGRLIDTPEFYGAFGPGGCMRTVSEDLLYPVLTGL